MINHLAEVPMAKRKYATFDEVWDEIHKDMSPEQLRSLHKAGFWAKADSYIRDFGFLTRTKREELGMTQMELAEYSGIQQKEISKIERGVGNPTLRTCQHLLGALGLELSVTDAKD